MSERFSERLERSVPDWVERKFLTKAAAAKLLAYERDREHAEPTSSKLVIFLSIIGSVFVGLGFILYFAANWDTMSDFTKFALLVVSTLSVSLAAYFCLYVRDMPKTGHSLALLGSLLYGASIFLVGQTYNLGGTVPGALLLWIAGVVPVAYVSGLSAYAFLLPAIALSWMIAEMEDSHMAENVLVWLPFAFGFFFSGIARWHAERYSNFSKIFARIGFFAVFSGLFLFTFDDVPYAVDASSYGTKLFFGIAAFGALAYAADAIRKKTFLPAEDATALAAVAFAALFAAAFSFRTFSEAFENRAGVEFAVTAFANVFFVAFAIGAIAAGLSKKSAFAVNVSMFFVAVFIFAKYFDWFFDMMDRALFFIF